MRDIIINILKQYKDCTALSEGHYDYMICGDEETLNDIAKQIETELKINLVD
jgi:hypothetical protein